MMTKLRKMSISACTLWSTSCIIKFPYCVALNYKSIASIMLSQMNSKFESLFHFQFLLKATPPPLLVEMLLRLCRPHGTAVRTSRWWGLRDRSIKQRMVTAVNVVKSALWKHCMSAQSSCCLFFDKLVVCCSSNRVPSVHRFGTDWNISTSFRWIIMIFCKYSHSFHMKYLIMWYTHVVSIATPWNWSAYVWLWGKCLDS